MKKLILAAAVGLTTLSALAQGQFTFGNKNTLLSPPLEAKVFLPNGTAASGAEYLAQAYVRLDASGSYSPVGSAVTFRTGANAGYIVSQVVTTSFPGGTSIQVAMRAWEAAKGASYEAAVAAGGIAGESVPINLTVTVAPNTPPDMVGLQSFTMVPEPSIMALGVLGVAALLLRRRS